MGRKKKQTDIEDTINAANGHAKPGHNSALSDDERRALTLHHKHLYEAADALVEKAKDDRRAIADQAKADLGKGALADIKDMIKAGTELVAKGNIERALRIARWMGLPVGTQVEMFAPATDEKAFEAGKAAGMQGDRCDPPRHFAVTEAQRWTAGWHDGQTILAGAFKKLKPEPAPTDPPSPQGGEGEPEQPSAQ